MATEREALLALATAWERESWGYEKQADEKRTPTEKHALSDVECRLLRMHGRVLRSCADAVKKELMKVRRG